MVNPHTSGVLNRDAIVVENTSDSHVLENNIVSVDHRYTISSNSRVASNDDRLVRANSKTRWKIEFAFNDDVEFVETLQYVSTRSLFN
jgi:hypothetical protein